VWLTLTVNLTLASKFQQYVYRHVVLVEVYLVVHSLWSLDSVVRTSTAVVF